MDLPGRMIPAGAVVVSCVGGRDPMRIVRAALLCGVGVVLAGCGGIPYSNPYASPDVSQRADCERSGGVWHSNLSVCEVPKP
jgi:hypothetical protein